MTSTTVSPSLTVAPSLTFQIASDLHLEKVDELRPKVEDFITPSCEILVLAGDIGSIYKIEQLEYFLKSACGLFHYVFYVPGNNEYYLPEKGNFKFIPFERLRAQLRQLEEKISNLVIFDQTSVRIDDVLFIGCTLWSDLQETRFPRFFMKIPDMTDARYRFLHAADLKYIKEMLSYCAEKKLKSIIVTHHVPSFTPMTEKQSQFKYKNLYASNLEALIVESAPLYWIYGHIHQNSVVEIEKTKLLCNQHGKPRDHVSNYLKNYTVTLF